MTKVQSELDGKRKVSDRSKKQFSAQLDKHLHERVALLRELNLTKKQIDRVVTRIKGYIRRVERAERDINEAEARVGGLKFKDMQRVYPVDTALVERITGYLLGKQAEDGSWRQQFPLTAYVAWALARSGEKGPGLQKALSYLRANASTLEDSYSQAVVANMRGMAR